MSRYKSRQNAGTDQSIVAEARRRRYTDPPGGTHGVVAYAFRINANTATEQRGTGAGTRAVLTPGVGYINGPVFDIKADGTVTRVSSGRTRGTTSLHGGLGAPSDVTDQRGLFGLLPSSQFSRDRAREQENETLKNIGQQVQAGTVGLGRDLASLPIGMMALAFPESKGDSPDDPDPDDKQVPQRFVQAEENPLIDPVYGTVVAVQGAATTYTIRKTSRGRSRLTTAGSP